MDFKSFLKEFYRPERESYENTAYNDFTADFFESIKKHKNDKSVFIYLNNVTMCDEAREIYLNFRTMYRTYKKFWDKKEIK